MPRVYGQPHGDVNNKEEQQSKRIAMQETARQYQLSSLPPDLPLKAIS
jgi:hypothetical protein